MHGYPCPALKTRSVSTHLEPAQRLMVYDALAGSFQAAHWR